MLAVSDAWKEVHQKAFLPESFVEISLSIVDNTVTGSVSGSNEPTFSKSSKLINNQNIVVSETYAFLEHNLWVLDGSKSILPDLNSYSPPGYVTNTDGDAVLTVNVTSAATTIPGFTITWSSEYDTYATDFIVNVKKGDTVVGTATVTNNSTKVSVVDLPASDYDSVIITVLGWSLPEQRTRIDSIVFGQTLVFGKNEIVDYSHEQSGDPLGTELTKNIIEFSVDNSDGRWNILNPTGMAKYLYERQELNVRYGLTVNGTVEWIDVGVFYLSEWRAPPDGIVMTFVARDFVEFLLNTFYSRPSLTGVAQENPTPVYNMFTLDKISEIPKGETVTIYGSLVLETMGVVATSPKYNNLHMYNVSNYGYVTQKHIKLNNNLYTDIRDALWSVRPDLGVRYNTFLKDIAPPISVDEMPIGEFIQKCLSSYGLTMWFDKAQDRVYFSSPSTTLSDYVIPMELAYKHPEVDLSKPLKRMGITVHYRDFSDTETYWYDVGADGDNISLDCPYLWQPIATSSTGDVANYNPSNVLERYKKWWGHREKMSGEFRADPRLELFDVVTVETKYGAVSPVMITYLKYTYNGSFRCVYEGKVCGDFNVTTVEE